MRVFEMAVAEDDSTAEVCLKVFTEHYPKLIDALPVEMLMAKFVSAKIVKFAEQDAILAANTQQEKARRFLQFVAVPLESSKKTHTFRSMLKVVEEHGGAYAYLAKDIYKDLLKERSIWCYPKMLQMIQVRQRKVLFYCLLCV